MRTLHIADGDSTAGTLKISGLAEDGAILSWRDALYSGPVPAHLTLGALSRIRSKYLTGGKRGTVFHKRDAILKTYRDYDEVVVWFGARCPLCVLSLAQVLSCFAEEDGPPTRLTWVSKHGGELNPLEMVQVFNKRRLVTSTQTDRLDALWRAFRSPSPNELSKLHAKRRSPVPGTFNIADWLLREYPSNRDGLSRLQRLLLLKLKSISRTAVSRIVGSILTRESVGDLFLFDLLERCFEVRNPLIRIESGKGKRLTYRSEISLTETGNRVLNRSADHVAMNGIDRWIGGVHLKGRSPQWRWDDRHKTITSH
jgi:hypothetical protein